MELRATFTKHLTLDQQTALLTQANHGDREALVRLWEHFTPIWYSGLWNKNHDDASDLIMNLFVILLTEKPHFGHPNQLLAYGKTRLRWMQCMATRRKKCVPMVSVEELTTGAENADTERLGFLADPKGDPADRIAWWDMERALAQLKPHQAAAVRLTYVEQWSVAEVARFLRRPVGTIKSDLSQARQQLQGALAA